MSICCRNVLGLMLIILLFAGCRGETSPPPGKPQAQAIPQVGDVKPAGQPDKAARSEREVAEGIDERELSKQTLIDEVLVTPARIETGQDISLQVVLKSESPEISRLQYDWYVNDEVYLYSQDEVLPADAFQRGDSIFVEIIPMIDDEPARMFRSDPFIVANASPRFTSNPEDASLQGGVFRYQVVAEDRENDPIRFTVQDSPKGLEIDEGSGLVNWVVPGDFLGSVSFMVIADDGSDKSSQVVRFDISDRISEGEG